MVLFGEGPPLSAQAPWRGSWSQPRSKSSIVFSGVQVVFAGFIRKLSQP